MLTPIISRAIRRREVNKIEISKYLLYRDAIGIFILDYFIKHYKTRALTKEREQQ